MTAAMETVHQHSAGGVAYRDGKSGSELVVIKTAEEGRWQLPKGIIDPGETDEKAALREVREEAGITCEIVEPIETIEYWFVGSYDGPKKRYHKKVSFFLMKYLSGDVADHDHEVTEARWVSFDDALTMLAFKNEKDVLEKARQLARA
jgi:8-oxo-dGTP pyrophosphatase MutT (NUDIX family)